MGGDGRVVSRLERREGHLGALLPVDCAPAVRESSQSYPRNSKSVEAQQRRDLRKQKAEGTQGRQCLNSREKKGEKLCRSPYLISEGIAKSFPSDG